jgi:hypothetical protein
MQKALEICRNEHNFRKWAPSDRLDKFLFTATVKAAFPSGANDFRRGMLAKIAVDGELAAGKVLLCETCRHEIMRDGNCGKCEEPIPQENPNTYRIWKIGRRAICQYQRCRKCGRLSYRYVGEKPENAKLAASDALCRYCGNSTWSTRTTAVWVPVEQVGWHDVSETYISVTGPQDSSGPQVHFRERQRRLMGLLSRWDDGVKKSLLRELLLRGERPDEGIACDLDPKEYVQLATSALRELCQQDLRREPTEEDFKQWVVETIAPSRAPEEDEEAAYD